MAITYRFIIDGTVITEAQNLVGWDKLVTSIKRDESDLKGLIVSQDVEFQFIGDLYRTFKDKYFNDGICSESTLLIEQSFDGVNFSRLHEGIIKLRDVVLTDMLKGEAKSTVKDNSFSARINNNKSIKTNPKGQWTKNGEPIGVGNTPASYVVSFFTPATGVFFADRSMMKLVDVMRYLVLWMSDGEVEFQSDFLETDLQLMIQRGDVLRLNVDPIPHWEVSFSDIYKNLKGLRDISYTIEYDAFDKPILRLELASYFYDDTLATDQNGSEIIFLNPTTLETKVKTQDLYSQIKLGSSVIANYPYLEFPEDIRYNGFKSELLYILGQCNIDNTLDLEKTFAVSSNDIEDCVVEGGATSGDYDEDIFLVHVNNIDDGALTADAVGTNPFGGTPPIFYNMALRNSEIANSYFGVFQNGLVAGFLNFTVNDFQGSLTVNNSTVISPPFGGGIYSIDPIPYQGEVDPGGNFNPATGYYTCPVTGFYTFNFYIIMDMPGVIQAFVPGNFFIRIVDDVGTILAEKLITNAIQYGVVYTDILSVSLFRQVGDLVGTAVFDNYFVTFANTNIRLLVGTRFSATATPDTGGVVMEYDPQDLRNVLMTFNYPILPQTFNSILQNTRGQYTIQCDVIKSSFKGWIEQIKYDHKSEQANITLKTSINAIGNNFPVSANKLPAYQFLFDMQTLTDEIQSFTYNNGVSTVAMSILLTQSISAITTQIQSAFGGAGISTVNIIITRTSLGGAMYRYKIIIVQPNFTIDIIDVSGNSTLSSFYYY